MSALRVVTSTSLLRARPAAHRPRSGLDGLSVAGRAVLLFAAIVLLFAAIVLRLRTMLWGRPDAKPQPLDGKGTKSGRRARVRLKLRIAAQIGADESIPHGSSGNPGQDDRPT